MATPEGRRRVTVTRLTEVWKGAPTTLEHVTVGDNVKILGLPQGQDFVAEKLYANITNRRGGIVVLEQRDHSVLVELHDHRAGLPRKVLIEASTGVVVAGIERAYEEMHPRPRLHDGQFIQALGLDQPNGPVLATRIWLD